MKIKKIMPFILAIILVIGLISGTALAAADESLRIQLNGLSGQSYNVQNGVIHLFSPSASYQGTETVHSGTLWRDGSSRSITWTVSNGVGTLALQGSYSLINSVWIEGGNGFNKAIVSANGIIHFTAGVGDANVTAFPSAYALRVTDADITITTPDNANLGRLYAWNSSAGAVSPDTQSTYSVPDTLYAIDVENGSLTIENGAELNSSITVSNKHPNVTQAIGIHVPDGNITVNSESQLYEGTITNQSNAASYDIVAGGTVTLDGYSRFVSYSNNPDSVIITAPTILVSDQTVFGAHGESAVTNTYSTTPTYFTSGTTPPEPQYVFPFTDVPEDAWYYQDVVTANKQKLIDGKTPTLFYPNDEMTLSEIIKLAACMNQLYTTGKVTLTNGTDKWYSTYMEYALEKGIIESDITDKATQVVTRSEYVGIFFKAFPADEFVEINQIADGAIPDVKPDTLNADIIYIFYRAGILAGSDEKGTFLPDKTITRCEVATILTRLMNKDARRSVIL